MQEGKKIVEKWTEIHGRTEGQLFQFANSDYTLIAIKGRAGALIDQIQFVFQNINSHQIVESPPYGGQGGSEFLYRVPQGQWVDRVFLKIAKDNVLIAFELETNLGIKSGRRGGYIQGDQVEIDAKGNRFTGIRCLAGQYVNALSFRIARAQQ